MAMLINHPTAVAQWHALVMEAEATAACLLDEELESYLVFLLVRFTTRPDLGGKILALEYLNAMLENGRVKQEALRDVGDHCLLYSGLFPQQADRRQVRVSYFVTLGRSAYGQISQRSHSEASLYAHLSQDFLILMGVLQAIRRMNITTACLAPLPAYELWNDTGSRKALYALREATQGFPIMGAEQDHLH